MIESRAGKDDVKSELESENWDKSRNKQENNVSGESNRFRATVRGFHRDRHMRKAPMTVIVFFVSALLAGAQSQTRPPTLKDAFRHAFLIGAAVNRAQFEERDVKGTALIKAHFNTISPENVLKWGSVHPSPDSYSFEAADRYVRFGEQNQMVIIGHTLVWHKQTPRWVFEDKKGKPLGRDALIARMRDHIHTVVGRYKGRIKGWDVVNEALEDNGTMRRTPWMQIIGDDYVAQAFKFAREADPGAELYYNDYELENPAKREGAIELIKRLKAQGVPVAAIGLQDHNRIDWPSVEQVGATIEAFAKLGIRVNITELDIDLLPAVAQHQAELNPYAAGLPEAIQQALARRYADLFAVFLQHQDVIDRVTFWGVADKDSWLNNWPVRGRTSYPLLFDRSDNPKPALEAILKVAQAKQAAATPQASPPYLNPELPIAKRVDDLVSRMTLEEKVSQMMNAAAPINRLGVPQYDWWNEALHGVARAGYATVFPQAIGLAATWDTELIYKVADVISTEARAKHHEFARQGQRLRYEGLTFWSPNINIFRDPRWGRGQETYGEDPYLTSKLGVAFVRGLQGNDPHYFKVIATPKHYAVHSGPEPERHAFDAKVSDRDLRETYLPAFRATVVEAHAASIMCAYNRTNAEPCCSNKELMIDVLRKEWAFDGYVVSDCGAITDIWKGHRFAKSGAEASALAVKAGTDLACGREYEALMEAVKSGLIRERDIDTSMKRLITARFKLGMFDPPEMVPYARIPISENDTPAHRELALKAARESIVLLKNENHTLPLKKDIRTIAVIGPNADALEVLLGNYFGQPSKYVTPLAGIKNKLPPETRVLYAPGTLRVGVSAEPVPPTALSTSGKGSESGLNGEYFNNSEMSGEPVLARRDEQINFDWGSFSPAPQVAADNFSARWTGKLLAPDTGKYLLGAAGNGGLRVFIDGKLLVDDFANRRTRTVTREITLEAGRYYDVRFDYVEGNNPYAAAKLVWATPGGPKALHDEAVNIARQADIVVAVMGISPLVEGEEMDVSIEGFRGGDRTDIGLPKQQEELLKGIQAVGKPVVLVLLNGSALAVNWASENVPAIVEAWYPGEEGGTAIGDVLFGDYNPGGRLPVTFYKSVDQLPPFEDYSMQGRTYRYFKGDPLYPFGFGLSYTTFKYENLKLSSQKINAGDDVVLDVTVQNAGQRAGEEVVQLYISDLSSSVPAPIRSLAGIERIFLRAAERRNIRFTLGGAQMSIINVQGKRVVEPGEFLISIGGKQPGFSGRADGNTTGVVQARLVVGGKVTQLTDR